MTNTPTTKFSFSRARRWWGVPLMWMATGAALAQPATAPAVKTETSVVVDLDQQGKAISPDLFGIFFEDLNYAADGGLYAELIQNRSFEYQAASNPTWNALTSWELVQRGSGKGKLALDLAMPIHPNNPHYAVIEVTQAGDGVGMMNSGFDGIPVAGGESYELSLVARHIYNERRWKPIPTSEQPLKLLVQLEGKDGTILGETTLEAVNKDWTRLSATITAKQSDSAARLVILLAGRGGVAIDVVSLMPKKTFKDRPNGLRADLAQTIADLKPKFMRFPGGCLVHGNGLGNMYRWKDTIGPIEQRKEQSNLWGYNQTAGLGYFEFFQFCEDIGAKPLPVVPAAVSCQNSGFTGGTGQRGVPLEEMPAYIQDVLDLVEYANGPVTSTWGAKRAVAGHPEPFNLQYLGVGNEDAQTPVFRERFKMIYDAVHAKYPNLQIIGTVGPAPAGPDYEQGWKFANEINLGMVDEHYYENPQWFLDNLKRYDTYDRSKAKVYLGEWASKGSAWSNALAESAYMTHLERNGDIVPLASYAPLLAKIGHTQWNPDLIYFNNETVFPSVNYYAHQVFSVNHGDTYLTSAVTTTPEPVKGEAVAVSSVRDSASGDVIIKLVNVTPRAMSAKIDLRGTKQINPAATRTVLAGEPKAKNEPATPRAVVPETSTFTASNSFTCDAPAHSVTVLRIKVAK